MIKNQFENSCNFRTKHNLNYTYECSSKRKFINSKSNNIGLTKNEQLFETNFMHQNDINE